MVKHEWNESPAEMERAALRRVRGLSTELQDVTELEYRQLRLERVVLAAVWTDGTAEDADNSLRELAALAETAGSQVLDGLVQRRPVPDPATYIGSGKVAELRDVVVATGADTVICDQYGVTTIQSRYIVQNNRWGTTATQCINVTSTGFSIIQQDGTASTSGAPEYSSP